MILPWLQRVVMQEAGVDAGGGGGGAPAPVPVVEPAAEGVDAPVDPPAQEPGGLEAKLLKQAELNKSLHRNNLKAQKQIKDLNAKLEEIAGRDKLWDENPIAALRARGIDYNELTKRIINSNNLTPEQQEQLKIRQELDELKTERQKRLEAEEKAAATKAETELLDGIQAQFEEAGEAYAFSAALGGRNEFLAELKNHLAETGENASPEEQVEIAQRLEKQMRDTVHSQVETLVKKSSAFREKLRAMLAATEEAPSNEEPDQQAETVETRVKPSLKRASSKTITQTHQTATGGRAPQQRLSLEERTARLLERLQGE